MVAKGNKKTKKARAKRRPGLGSMLASQRIHDHARMIVDPCNAPLKEGIYGGSAGTYTTRVVKVENESHTPATNAGQYYWGVAFNPVFGAYKLYGSSGADWVIGGSSVVHWERLATLSPAIQNASRSYGACVRMTWGGKELDRKGLIFSGVVNGSVIFDGVRGTSGGQGNYFTMEALVAQLPNTCRTPNDSCEINWVPTEADAEYREYISPGATVNAGYGNAVSRTNFAVMVFTAPQAVGETVSIEVRTVAILEQQYAVGGIITNAAVVSPGPVGSVSQIITALQSRDPHWYINAFKKTVGVVGRLGASYAKGGALGMVAEVAGMFTAPRKNIAVL